MRIIKGHQIKSIYTKFYYLSHNLCYDILISLKEGVEDGMVFKSFNDYNEYKKAFKKIQLAQVNNTEISIPSVAGNYDNLPIRQATS